MRVPGWLVAAIVGFSVLASADPKPTEIDTKAFRDQLIVLQDAQGGTYAVLRSDASGSENRVFYGKGKELYEQWEIGFSKDENSWMIDTWTPRLPDIQHGALMKNADGTYKRWCAGLDDAGLTLVTGDKAKKVLGGVKIMSQLNPRVPYLFARDDAGVYYYVDRLRGGEAYRVFVGKKGAMKQTTLSDVAIDQAGSVFSTKTGDLRLVRSQDSDKQSVKWVHGDKGVDLHFLDVDAHSRLIFKDLGVYGSLGDLCDNA